MRVAPYKELYQFSILPVVKVTYDRMLNGDLELIMGWGRWFLAIQI